MYNLKHSGNVSKTVKSGNLLNIPKYADITPVFKTGDTESISNHGPSSTYSNFSKIFEKFSFTKINTFMKPKLSKYLAGLNKKHNTQHALLKMKWTSQGNFMC